MANNGMMLKVGLDLQTNEAIKTFNDWSNRVQAQAQKNPIKIAVDLDGQKWEKTIQTFVAKNGDLVESTKYVNLATKEEHEQITKVTDAFTRLQQESNKQVAINNAINNSQHKLNTTAKKSIDIFSDFTTTFMKMVKFNTINQIYDGITNSLSNAITIVEQFNEATTELRKVSDLEGESLKAYTKDLAEYGEVVGRTLTDMVNSATIFKRTGATDEEAMKLAQVAEMYRNVADSEISSAEASSFLVSQMKAFNITADQSIRVIDSINEVANRHAVSTNDLQIALSKAAASMATAGNTYEETIALVEGATAIMQNQAGTVGNGLRTLAINIASLATESDEFVAANGKVSVSLKDEQGQLRSTYDILNDLSKVWGNLNSSEQMAIAKDLGGKTRFNVITSLMTNFADAQQSLADALGSTGSAMQENARYMESISA